jgi:predicted exporter
VIGLLFYLTHRRVRPLLWLLAWLLFLLAATVAIGGLLFGTVNVVSLGFAAILTGLAEDFGIVLYEETQSHPELDAKQIRHEAAPGIIWSAITTAGGFLALNLSGLPGLGQLGSFVAIGITLAAVLMLYGFVPPLLRWRRPDRGKSSYLLFAPVRLLPSRTIWIISLLLLAVSGGILWVKPPSLDRSSDPLRPKKSEAYETLGELRKQLGQREEPLWVLIPAKTEAEVLQRMERTAAWMDTATNKHLISGYTLPLGVWPRPSFQEQNKPVISRIVAGKESVVAAAMAQGFTTNALVLTKNIFAAWEAALASSGVYWPTNESSTWLLDKFSARTGTNFIAAGFIRPEGGPENMELFAESLPRDLKRDGVLVSGWQLLGRTVFSMVMEELPKLMTAICGLVLLSLWLAFRSFKQVLLSVGTLIFSAVCLWAAMDMLNWRWNLLSLMALPLFIGVGVDFSIHIQLALRRYNGDRAQVRKSVGRALLLAGSTTLAGFGSLAFSSNFGMASLGKVCALGLMITMLTAIYLLPVWWELTVGTDRQAGQALTAVDQE